MLKELACYHGYIERRDAEKLLLHEGDFLLQVVQFEGPFHGKYLVLSVKSKNKAHHVLVSRSKGQYRIDETIEFGTIDELIKNYSHTTSKPESAGDR